MVGPRRTIDLCDDIAGQNAEKGISELLKDVPGWDSKVVGMLKLMSHSGVF